MTTQKSKPRKANSADLTVRAEAQIHLAIRRLGGKYIFHARVLEQFVLRHLPGIQTMGVSASGENVSLAYNAEFVLRLPLDQLVGVLLHEVHHVVFKHIFLDPNDFPNLAALTVAAELVVNEFVREPLPDGAITLEMFPRFPPMESTLERYRRLDKIVPPNAAKPLTLPLGSKSTRNGQGRSGQGKVGASVVDDHTLWEGARQDQRGAEALVDNLLKNAANGVSEENVPGYIKRQLGGRLAGWQPGNIDESVKREEGKLDWVRLLRRYVGQALKVRRDYLRPARRFAGLVGIVPGKRRLTQRPQIMAVIDTSGSMTSDILARISGELGRLSADYGVTIVECDCEIQNVYPYKVITKVSGRGGTSFLPPLEPTFLRKHRPDLIVFFTDGFGPAPDHPPRAPVIWCLTPNGRKPATWGRVIQMEG